MLLSASIRKLFDKLIHPFGNFYGFNVFNPDYAITRATWFYFILFFAATLASLQNAYAKSGFDSLLGIGYASAGIYVGST